VNIRARLAGPFAALLVIALVLAGSAPRTRILPLAIYDQGFYLGIAYDLTHAGRFTNGYVFQETQPDQPRPPGMRFTPLYPALLAAASMVDPGFDRAMSCVVTSRGGDASCGRNAALVRSVQYAMVAWTLWLVWWMGSAVSGARSTGWLALLLMLACAPGLAGAANNKMTEVLALALTTSAIAAGVRGVRPSGRAWRWFAVAGACAAASALTRPAFLYAFVACLLAGALLVIGRHRSARRCWLAFAAAGAAVLTPWIIRNMVVMHVAGLTNGYGPQVLVQRLAFDQMDWAEWRLSFLCWLPDGNGMGELLFGRGACHRFGWSDTPDTFYEIGNGKLMQDSLAAAGGWDGMMRYLVANLILPDLPKYLLVSLPLAMRGVFVNHYWGLVLAPVCGYVTWRAWLQRNWALLIVTLPPWFMLALAAAVSVNQTRYNLLLEVPFAIAGALAIEKIMETHYPKFTRAWKSCWND